VAFIVFDASLPVELLVLESVAYESVAFIVFDAWPVELYVLGSEGIVRLERLATRYDGICAM